ncbi:hypothetical protein GGTG_10268 [Gaeumannomyces tritici R3-111a-1]|uniref:Sterol-4-alpha-carboxylate 3-dehydrogenase ERG26, decarboxylating n=1 Tax=Gaeumannomyces tritici (strain R3-111a-1) TaxID=644352 RepID=J3P9U4_GAET3|nr:hypothetical protein GGTG_10268 [Gaeumannomyces tritici R3-111a-1]EJT73430.1 hypothetical protein GGTG_10268 [Gaeumannomyces tritici R3-111a-1]
MAEEAKPNLGRVLVIGGCGFLGHHVVRMLIEGYRCTVSVIDLRCTRNRRPESDGVRYVDADITDAARLASVFEELKPDVVIHTASPLAQGDDKASHDLFRRVNVDGTAAVVEACRSAAVKALVFTSSASVVSDNHSDLVNADERWPVIRGADQSEYYSETKAAAEQIVIEANEPSRLLTVAIRPAGIIGEGDAMAIPKMVQAYQEGKWSVQVGDNNNIFDFTYVGNVAHAHLLAARALLITHESATAPLEHERVDGEVFLVTNDSPLYFWDFARMVWKAAGSPHGVDRVWVLPREVGLALGWLSEMGCWLVGRAPTLNRQRIIYSCMTRYYNIDKAKRRLGYKPLVSLEEGVRRGVADCLSRQQAAAAAK